MHESVCKKTASSGLNRMGVGALPNDDDSVTWEKASNVPVNFQSKSCHHATSPFDRNAGFTNSDVTSIPHPTSPVRPGRNRLFRFVPVRRSLPGGKAPKRATKSHGSGCRRVARGLRSEQTEKQVCSPWLGGRGRTGRTGPTKDGMSSATATCNIL